MYKTTKYKLNNGKEFDTEKEAQKELNNSYGLIVEKIAHNICSLDFKFEKVLLYINDNTELFRSLTSSYDEMISGVQSE